MTRSRLKSVYLKIQNSKNWENYKKQKLFHKFTEYFRNVNINDLNNNKIF